MKTAAQHIAEMQARAATDGSIDATYARPALSAHQGKVFVIDDVLDDPIAYRELALHQPFESVTVGAATFYGIGTRTDSRLPDFIASTYPSATPTLTFFRKSPKLQAEPNFIHTDRDMGEWTGILYLTEKPAHGDGTTFWMRRDTEARSSTAATLDELHAEWLEWRDMTLWKPWTSIEAKLNRLVLFSAPLFHSRSLRENYGRGDRARLTQLVFGTGDLA